MALEATVEFDIDVLESKLYQESLVDFVRCFWDCVLGAGKLTWNWHLEVFCIELERIAKRVFAGLPKEYDEVVNVSPGTSKSTIYSILFPAWVWTNMPGARILTASHTDSLVLDLATKARSVIKSEKYQKFFPFIKLREDQDTKHYYANTLGGDRYTCTVGGKSPMGFHAHFIIVDDPIDPQKTASEVELEQAGRFMTEVIPTRKVDKVVSVTILIMQRLHHRDPTAVMIESASKDDADKIRKVCLPAEETEDISPANETYYIDGSNKTLRQMYGEGGGLMDPVRLSKQALKPYKSRGELFYATQFLQKPFPPGGGMFKEQYFNKRVKASPYHAKRVWFWDRAATEDGGCYTAGVLLSMVLDPLLFYVEDCVHGQWEPVERNQRMRAAALKTRSRYGPKNEPIILVEAEGGSSGRDAWLMVVRALAGFNVKEINVTGSKDARAEPWSAQLAAGNVWIVDNGESEGTGKALWDIAGYVLEHTLFRPEVGKRLGKFKDQVDASSGAFNYLVGIPANTGFRTVGFTKKKGMLKIVVVNREELANLLIEPQHPVILVQLLDPMYTEPCGHAIDKPLDRIVLPFADINPPELQNVWEEILPPYNKKPEELIMTKDHGKKLWRSLLSKRDPPAQVFVIQDEGDRKGLSLALGICDALGFNKKETIYLPSSPDKDMNKEKPSNPHVYETTKITRHSVIG